MSIRADPSAFVRERQHPHHLGELKQDGYQRLPLVVYTVKDLDPSERQQFDLGRTLFLTKARVPPDLLEKKVRAILEQDRLATRPKPLAYALLVVVFRRMLLETEVTRRVVPGMLCGMSAMLINRSLNLLPAAPTSRILSEDRVLADLCAATGGWCWRAGCG